MMQMQREILKQYKILREIFLQQVRIFATQNRVSSALFGYSRRELNSYALRRAIFASFGYRIGENMYSNGVSEISGTVGQMKKSGKLWIVVLGAIIGLGLLVVGSLELPFFQSESKNTAVVTDEQAELQAYRQQLSSEIASLCAEVRGVGKVQVMVTLSGGYEYVYARDLQSKTGGDTYTWEETYVIVGSGSAQSPLLLVKKQPSVAGVGIVCEGGADPSVQNELIALVSATFGIGANKIHVTASQIE